jgi:hypothetical protein
MNPSGVFPAVVLFVASIPFADAAITLDPSTRGRVGFVGPQAEPTGYMVSTDSSASLPVGDGATNNTVFSALFNFTVSAHTAEISSATQILFNVTISSISANPPSQIRLVALTNDTNTVFGARSVAAGDIVATLNVSPLSMGQTISFDVTNFVKADALAGNFSSYRLESDFAANNTNGAGDILVFGTIASNDANLEVIPEPGSSGLLAGAAAVALLFRKRRLS